MNRELSLEFVRVTEAAAIACGHLVGRGDKNGADGLAVDAMRAAFDTVNIKGTVVILAKAKWMKHRCCISAKK